MLRLLAGARIRVKRPADRLRGGEFSAYFAYHDAYGTGNAAEVIPRVSNQSTNFISEPVNNGVGTKLMKNYTREHPTKSVKLAGDAAMVREAGRGVVDEDLADVKLQ